MKTRAVRRGESTGRGIDIQQEGSVRKLIGVLWMGICGAVLNQTKEVVEDV